MIVDLFAGPGGWSEAVKALDLGDEVGIDIDRDVADTRLAAGHSTYVASTEDFPDDRIRRLFDLDLDGVIASPPCTDFSAAGLRAGIEGKTGALVHEVIRWTEAVGPPWLVCEQVPDVLPIWRAFAHRLVDSGYHSWSGILNAADYGVPQKRHRAILIASRVKPVGPPPQTHAEDPRPDLFGDTLKPWVTMAEALGWDPSARVGFPRLDDTGTSPDGYRERDWFPASEPANSVTEKAHSWMLNPGLTDTQPNRRLYGLDEPAPTIAFGHDAANWAWLRPATTVQGDPRIWPPGHKVNADDRARLGADVADERYGDRAGTEAIRVTISQALVLQSFRADYPLAGSMTSQFRQVGNAIPPLLAEAILKVVAS